MNNKFTAIDPEYYNKGSIQCIDAMISAKGIEKVKAFCDCNAFKYEWRVGNKDKIEQDVDKTIWYLNKLKELWGKTETYKSLSQSYTVPGDGSLLQLSGSPQD